MVEVRFSMSMAPRPQTTPSTSSAAKGSRCQPDGLTGTTSVWPMRSSVGAFLSLPSMRVIRLMRPGEEVYRSQDSPEPAKNASRASQLRSSWPEDSSPVFTQRLRMRVRRSSVAWTSMSLAALMSGSPGGGVDLGPDLAREALEDRHHVVEIAVARFEQEGADAELAVTPDIAEDLLGRALKRLAVGAAGRLAEGQPHAQGDRQVLEGAIALRALLTEPRDVAREGVGRREGGVPAVAQLGHAAQGPRGVTTHPDRDGPAPRLRHHPDLVEGEELAAITRPLLRPAGTHDPDGLVRPRAPPVVVAAQDLDLLAH